MQAADYIAGFLAQNGVTDAFGIPGGVILELLYALDRAEGITPHLCYHEQGAAFAAAGYGQCGPVPGVAFATCGPGVTNTLTAVADAYCDSTPMLVFTAHAHAGQEPAPDGARFYHGQEMALAPVFAAVTKACIRVDALAELPGTVLAAWAAATTGRKGPVVVDILSGLFTQELPTDMPAAPTISPSATDAAAAADDIARHLAASKRPVLLFGKGIRLAGVRAQAAAFAEKWGIPVLSSRYAQDIMPGSPLYFGYIGTHAVRAANFILSKADLIVALGNRLAFPVQSQSFRPLTERTKILRVDVDPAELGRAVPNTAGYCADLADVLPALARLEPRGAGYTGWLEVCRRLQNALAGYDTPEPVQLMAEVLRCAGPGCTVTSDVGNNEMWLSRAYHLAGAQNRVLYSQTFGALGCSLPKAIGAQFATRAPVLCFTGDQGLQMNVQELQTVAVNRLPILIAVLNNRASSMIREHEQVRHPGHPLLVTDASGYAAADLQKLAGAYGIPYRRWRELPPPERQALLRDICGPLLLDIEVEDRYDVQPSLKRGEPCQKLFPYLDAELYSELDEL